MDAQKALSCIYRTGQRFGIGYIVEIFYAVPIINAFAIMVMINLPVYGIGKAHSHEYWMSVIRQLIHLGMVAQNIVHRSALQLTEIARPDIAW